jgi:Mg-chelatase subunit ChlD
MAIIKNNNALQKPHRVGGGLPALHQRVLAQVDKPIDLTAKPNRVALICDNSGSMSAMDDYNVEKSRIEYLREAVQSFLQSCNPDDTEIAIYNFGGKDEDDRRLGTDFGTLTVCALTMQAQGGTPMGWGMEKALREPLSRAVLISDGEATDGDASYKQAETFCAAQVPVDCIHIGPTESGEARLRRIAELTGGIYIKFKDVAQLATKLHYLTPAYRGLLCDKNEAKLLLGADEVD